LVQLFDRKFNKNVQEKHILSGSKPIPIGADPPIEVNKKPPVLAGGWVKQLLSIPYQCATN
jgi:hypothetical protein